MQVDLATRKRLKTIIQEMKAKVEMNIERIKVLLDTNKERFMRWVRESKEM